MTSTRTAVSAVAAWLVVVAVGSTLVWVVISRAGDGLTPSTGPAVAPPTTQSATDRPSGGTSDGSEPHRRTWQGAGGLVTVECDGSDISLVASSADTGFVVEPEKQGPDEVRVSFEGQGEEGRETRLRAHCEDGTPVFEADTEGD